MATGYRILVADKLADEGLAYLKEQNADFDVNLDLKDEAKFAATVGDYDALIVRSGVKVTAKVLENPGKLRAIARAGVGVDNIHLPTATEKGILVMNTAEASTLSTAEHALALMMSLARKIPAAHASLSRRRPRCRRAAGSPAGRGSSGRRPPPSSARTAGRSSGGRTGPRP